MKKIFLKTEVGFTIIEIMVSVSIFIIIVMSGTAALLNANLLSQKSKNMRSILDSLNFAMDDMSRNIRTGSIYHCFLITDSISTGPISSQSCGSGRGISFISSSPGGQWVYYVGTNSVGTNSLFRSVNGEVSQLTPNEVVISSYSSTPPFSVLGATAGDKTQPYVTIKLSGEISYRGYKTPFSLQTSVTQRLLDIAN